MKKKLLTTTVALGLSLSIGINAFAVSDISGHWAKDSIEHLIEGNIISGYTDGTFKPEKDISRAEFLKLVNRVFENEETGNIDFKDVKKGHSYYDDVRKGVAAGYISGYTDKTFRPNNPIDRQEAAIVIVRALELESYNPIKELDFVDRDEMDSWAERYIDIVVERGHMNGYTDNRFRPKNPLKRGEAAKILSDIKKHMEDDTNEDPATKPVYSVQAGSFKTENEAMKMGQRLLKAGYKDSFISKDSYDIYYVIVNDFRLEKDARGLANKLKKEGYNNTIVINRDFKDYKVIEIKPEPKPDPKPNHTANMKTIIDKISKMPEANTIGSVTESLLIDIDSINNQYNKLTATEKKDMPGASMTKFRAIETRVNSLKTNIMSASKTSVEKAQQWARNRGAHKRFVDIAPVYWKYGKLTGINPEILYAQAAKETNFGKYTGSVKPEMNNWAGIKIANPKGDNTYDHETFATPEDGVRGHFNHMGIYVGVDPIGKPHPRWYVTSKVGWRGTVKKVEDLGGKWAPSRDYGVSIMRDYVNQIYKVK